MSAALRRLASLAALAASPAVIIALNAPATSAASRTATTPTSSAAPRAITPGDISSWKSIRGPSLSRSGAWFAYTLAPNEGDAFVIIRETTNGGKEHRFPVGEAPAGGPFGAGGVQLSPDGKWASFLVYPTAAEQKRMRGSALIRQADVHALRRRHRHLREREEQAAVGDVVAG